ncbi:MAG TPA: NAD(P)H-dependent oxidoreductase [Candidatus Omnitrophota bacterium]|mgnify:CR=1 FL=1|nr:NAD(P)H-dependent oxidoreductase [Candidatus Omnitrophota bacterium]HNQ50019.1 NAD(P)H-dependent oxidoreductase [Candidatus Omnitrophota bacterium]HQO37771.1 NAD(P)H-dependent oxidoreductase [Candidatus Omnitrophota bacterium]HQQ05843.1 NAD(P)H-dependent oxidoreductase [Candidatus Omnitrophota bacterium]
MRISVILAHPSPRSFNAAIARTVVRTLKRNRHSVIFHDLYREQFDPVLPEHEIRKNAKLPARIKKHCEEISSAQGLVIIHPNWWGEPPAILKGWVDRVLRPGVAYDFPPGPEGAAGLPIEMLGNITKVLIFNTSDTPAKRENQVLGDPLQKIWENTLAFCGAKCLSRKMFRVVVTSTPQMRARWLKDVVKRVETAFKTSLPAS